MLFDTFDKATLDSRIHRINPSPSVPLSIDLEPEYIAVSHDSKTAWVTLQENNALAVLDIEAARFTSLLALGFRDHNRPGNALDASDQDGGIRILNWPALGMYQPDAIDTLHGRHHGIRCQQPLRAVLRPLREQSHVRWSRGGRRRLAGRPVVRQGRRQSNGRTAVDCVARDQRHDTIYEIARNR